MIRSREHSVISAYQRLVPTPKTSALALARWIEPLTQTRPHLNYLDELLTANLAAQERGESTQTLVSLPPRTGKSTLCAVWYPLYALTRNPTLKIGLVSHTPDLATSWARTIRDHAQNPRARIQVHKATRWTASEWRTSQGGGLWARSVGQALTGLGFDLLILDDVVKDHASAHSPANRRHLWDWWQANTRTRLEPPYTLLIVGTRWHTDDLIGRLTNPEYTPPNNDQPWQVVNLPAIAPDSPQCPLGRAPGDPLYTPLGRQTREAQLLEWAKIRAAVGTRTWQALYQGTPTSEEGRVFHAHWWQRWRVLPQSRPQRDLTSWDMAFKPGAQSDWVVGQHWQTWAGDRYLVDQIRGRWTFSETVRHMRAFVEQTGAREHLVEDRANGTAIIDTLRREIPGIIPINPTQSKTARAQAVTPEIEAGNVFLPTQAGWLPEFLLEVEQFPAGAHDDQVDALTQALSRLRLSGVGGARVSRLAAVRQLS